MKIILFSFSIMFLFGSCVHTERQPQQHSAVSGAPERTPPALHASALNERSSAIPPTV